MRKIISLGLGLALSSVVLLAIPASAAPATVSRDLGQCVMAGAGPDGELVGALGIATHVVQNGNHVVMKCKGKDIQNDSGRTQHFSGFQCGVPLADGGGAVTVDSRATVTKNGNATMTCRFDLDG